MEIAHDPKRKVCVMLGMLAAAAGTIATSAAPSWVLTDTQSRTERVMVPGTLVRHVEVRITPEARAAAATVAVTYGTTRDASCREEVPSGPLVSVDEEGLPLAKPPKPSPAVVCSYTNYQTVELSRACPDRNAFCVVSFDLLVRATEGSGGADVTWFASATIDGDGVNPPDGARLTAIAPPDPGPPKDPPTWKPNGAAGGTPDGGTQDAAADAEAGADADAGT